MTNDSDLLEEAIDEIERRTEASMPGAFLDMFLFLTMLASVGVIAYGTTLFYKGKAMIPVAWAIVGSGTSNLLLSTAIFGARESAGTALEAIAKLARILKHKRETHSD